MSARRAAAGFAFALLAAGAAPLAAAEGIGERLDAYLRSAYPAGGPGAAAIVVDDGKVLLREGYGLANLELGVPIEPEMVFRIGSVTKQFTAVAALLLVAEGKLALDDEIIEYLPDYPTGGRKITVEHLLTHTSGIKSYTALPEWLPRRREDLTVPQMIALFKDQPMDFAPGEKWAYNNSGYFLLGAVLEKASGQSYEELLRSRIFAPLGMKRTGYGHVEPILPGRVAGYQRGRQGWVNAPYLSMTQPYAAGSLVSTVDDLALWNAALDGGQLLPRAALARAWTPYKLRGGKATGYGYGWGIVDWRGHHFEEHGGGIDGFQSYVLREPREGLFVAVLSNALGHQPDPDMVATKLALLALGESIADPPVVKVAPEVLDAYTGVYRIDETTTRVVTREGDRLFTQRSGGEKLEALPLSESEFFYRDSFERASFRRDAAGRVTGMVLHSRQRGDEEAVRTDEAPPAKRVAVRVEPAVLARYVGEYELMPGFTIVVTQEGEKLFGQATGQPRFELSAASETAFFLEVVDAQLDFVLDAAGAVTGLVLHQGGRDMPGKKIR
ncbi:MAG TPA: serine hydrolase [Thermoanaerobaculia bacterium]|nr:serine hydrolase [Thermoanaerobaculia bacterium]